MRPIYLLLYFLLSLPLLAQEDSLAPILAQEDSLAPIIDTTGDVYITVHIKAPVSSKKLNLEQIKDQSLGQDLPALIKNEVGTVSTSDAGGGIGYTALRVRGLDQTQINVNLNGITLNDSESQNVFWVNMPDLTSSLGEVRLQRGVGTTNPGPAAFGAGLDLKTPNNAYDAFFNTAQSVGSFGSRKHTFQAGTGRFANFFSIDGRVSFINSDGYVDRAESDLNSYYVNAQYQNRKTQLNFLSLGGHERTYQSWFGVDANTLETNRTYNPAGEIRDAAGNLEAFYENQVDDYRQNHYQLILNQRFSNKTKLNTVLHYTYGRGFFEEYQDDYVNALNGSDYNVRLENYGLEPLTVNGSLVDQSDLTRRRWLKNHFYGLSTSLEKESENITYLIGLAANRYEGNHFGRLLWVKEAADYFPDQEFYRNKSVKDEFNVYAKALYRIKKNIDGFLDLQYRYLDYRAEEELSSPNIEGQPNFDKQYHFINPKLGFQWQQKYGKAFLTGGIARREPRRSDLLSNPNVTHENLYNIELGYTQNKHRRFSYSANLYYMHFDNQLVLTGAVDNVGGFIRDNVGRSYRLGLELDGAFRVNRQWQLFGNLALSRNKILDYSESIPTEFFLGEPVLVNYGDTDISFSPEIIGNLGFQWQILKGLSLRYTSKFVSEQYMSPTNIEASTLDSYFVSDVLISYSPKLATEGIFKELKINGLINNLFDERYENNGYFFNTFEGNAAAPGNLANFPFYYPQAGINFLVGVFIGI